MTILPSMGVKERYRGHKKDSNQTPRDGNTMSELNSPRHSNQPPSCPSQRRNLLPSVCVRGLCASHVPVPFTEAAFPLLPQAAGISACASNEISLQESMGEVW